MTTHAHPHHRDAHARHSHRFLRPAAGRVRSALYASLLITGLFMLAEVVVGFLANSLALLADAGHMFTDVTALVISLFAVHLVSRPANPRMTYGYYRLEILAALTNGILLLGITTVIVVEAVRRLGHPEPVRSVPMLLVAVLGLLANLGCIDLLRRAEGGLNIRAAMLHVLSDAGGSAATIVAASIIMLTGWTAADPLISLLIAGLIVAGGVRVISEAIHVLMEATPHHLDLEEVEAVMRSIPGVQGVHDLHVWTVTSGLYALSAHVVVDGVSTPEAVLTTLKDLLIQRFDLVHTTLQIESGSFIETKGHV